MVANEMNSVSKAQQATWQSNRKQMKMFKHR